MRNSTEKHTLFYRPEKDSPEERLNDFSTYKEAVTEGQMRCGHGKFWVESKRLHGKRWIEFCPEAFV